MVVKWRQCLVKVMSSSEIASQRIHRLLDAYLKTKSMVSKKNNPLFVWVWIVKSVPRDHRLPLLGKPRNAKRWSSGHILLSHPQMHDTIYTLVSKKHISFSWSWVFMSLLSRATSINRTKLWNYLNTSTAPIISLIIGHRREKTCLRGFANNKGADQPAHPRRLISAFVIGLLERFISKLATSKNLSF